MIRNRDQARDLFDHHGITSSNVSDKFLQVLWDSINKMMQQSYNYQGSYKMVKGVSRFMTCETYQWYGREAISFNSDGFIGIAGWADDNNVRPIFDGIEMALEAQGDSDD